MAAPSTGPKNGVSEITDGNNIRPTYGRMGRLAITLVDADRHNERWGYDLGRMIPNGAFHLTRVKTAAQH